MRFPDWQCTGHGDSPRRRPPDPLRPRSHHFRLPQLLRPRSYNPTTVPLSPTNRIPRLCPPWPIATPSPALSSPRSHRPHPSRRSLVKLGRRPPSLTLSGARRQDCTWRDEARYWRRDATNGKSQRVPAAANGKAIKAGLLAEAPGAGSRRGPSPTGSAMEGGALWGHRPLQSFPVTTNIRLGNICQRGLASHLSLSISCLGFAAIIPSQSGKGEEAPQAKRRRAAPEAPSLSSPPAAGFSLFCVLTLPFHRRTRPAVLHGLLGSGSPE